MHMQAMVMMATTIPSGYGDDDNGDHNEEGDDNDEGAYDDDDGDDDPVGVDDLLATASIGITVLWLTGSRPRLPLQTCPSRATPLPALQAPRENQLLRRQQLGGGCAAGP